jgi:hypothetical protein
LPSIDACIRGIELVNGTINMKKFSLGLATTLAGITLLASCAAYGPGNLADGATEDQISRTMGAPNARYLRPGEGQRLEYRRGPAGLHTYMLDLDSQGRLVRKDQVLDQRHFSALQPGATKEQVLFAIGHPGMVQTLGYQQRDLWSYRYEAPICQLFQVSFGQDGIAVEVGYGRDPSCDPDTL